ncbi:hypothetical protein B0T19DRAFT_462713 [Cercophora scortea]|uniref:Protein NO VEIN C-terminal domain-containing protein n=1 Tax=Cercophora scortea TaxID=314031 RepID=A0AAE0IE31_9PEZI|nr:hypothetical protein B0T19DRAFT_462713 [Cercophora scortea]
MRSAPGLEGRRAADQHLRRIRANYGLDGNFNNTPQPLVKSFESACKLLSEQLYKNSTHFLLELVQNSDDASYHPHDEPTLHFTYTKGYLRVDCNEVGFSPSNVDALCSLGLSSKAGAGASQFTGEKGIGFKSVFKVANQVWVTSQHYEFKFDGRPEARLGMVAPILEDFPAAKRKGWTSFLLELKPEREGDVVKDLRQGPDDGVDAKPDSESSELAVYHMKPQLLLFLRGLRQIVITIQCRSDAGNTIFRTKTWRREDDAGFARPVMEARYLRVDGAKLAGYLIRRHWARGLPADEKRNGVRESEVILAFPLDEDMNQPRLGSQAVCAYLPIRDYSFPFFIHADFLLIASREDIDQSSKWNEALGRACISALDESVRWFNGSRLRYDWPRFLPVKLGPPDEFFYPFTRAMLQYLSHREILETLNGDLRQPCRLIYVPRAYRDGSGTPLTAGAPNSEQYLSTKYNDQDFKHVKSLGVKKMDHGLFLDHLERQITTSLDEFKAQPTEWHSRLAVVLAEVWESEGSSSSLPSGNHPRPAKRNDDSSDCSDGDYKVISVLGHPQAPTKKRILSLPVIPLRDGRWVTGTNYNVLFSAATSAPVLPGGMGFMVIDSNASQDSRRANLYRILGAKNFDPKGICKIIIEGHASPSFKPDAVTRADLISQAQFLYRSGWSNNDGEEFLWLATELDNRARGDSLYIDDESEPLSATHFFASRRNDFAFIHPDYLAADGGDEENRHRWLRWLKTQLCLSSLPRLARILRRVNKSKQVFAMSPEFEYILATFGSYPVLKLLCEHTAVYRSWIVRGRVGTPTPQNHNMGSAANAEVDLAVDVSYRRLNHRIRSLMVECTDDTLVPLRHTVLPVSRLPQEVDGCVSFLKLEDPDHPRWKALGHFGVCVEQDLDFYFHCLRNFSQSGGASLRKATFLYEQIQARCSTHNKKMVANMFHGDNFGNIESLLYVPVSGNAKVDPDNGVWHPLGLCVWDGPKCLRVLTRLSKVYPSCVRLFAEVLEIKDASMLDIMWEATRFELDDHLGHIRAIFLEIDTCMQTDATYTHKLDTLAQANTLPVIKDTATADNLGHKFDSLLKPGSELFIADTKPLLDSFIGLVPLLAFGTDDIPRMKRLIHGLGMNARYLSRAHTSVPKTSGPVEFDGHLTGWFQLRYEFIARLVEPSVMDPGRRKRVLGLLRNIQIFVAKNIVQGYRVQLEGAWIEGRERPGNVVLAPSEDGSILPIYVKHKYLSPSSTPFELVEQLAQLTGIHEREEGKWLLHMILTEQDLAKISAILEDKGVPEKFDDDDDDDEEAEADSKWRNKLAQRRSAAATRPQLYQVLPPGGSDGRFFILTAQNLLRMFGGDATYDSDDEGAGVQDGVRGVGNNPWAGRSGFRLVSASSFRNNRRHMPPREPDFDEDRESKGQLFFSKQLAKILGDKYKPEAHWTSTLRTKHANHNLPAYQGDAICSFTFNDAECNGAWTKAVVAAEYHDARGWLNRPPTWHIEVKTVGTPAESFALSHLYFELARSKSVAYQEQRAMTTGWIPAEVVMLVVVYDMVPESGEAKFQMFPDPWTLYLHKLLKLKPTGNFIARLPFAGQI